VDGDRNLLFGVLALQSGLITRDQFADACREWSVRKSEPIADLLVQKGWINAADREHLAYLVDRAEAAAATSPSSGNGQRASAEIDADGLIVQMTGSGSSRPAAAGAGDYPSLSSRYQLERLHAAGGIGEIWLARDAELNRDVAIKRLRSESAKSELNRSRFLREAQITGQLDHPGVVPVYELCHDSPSGQPYYAMRFLKGQTLAQAVAAFHDKRRAGEAPARDFLALLNVFVIVCKTVSYAHSKNIIHRDLKCENVLLGDFGEVVVVDWGLAKVLGTPHLGGGTVIATPEELASPAPVATVAGRVMGTPAYMAPEQAEGRLDLIDRSTDIYGLSAMLYEILTGQAPFFGNSTVEVLQKVSRDEPVPPSQIVPDVPAELERICLRGLSKSPAQRHASAEELAASVEQWMADRAERTRAQQERAHFFSLSQNLLAVVDDRQRLKQTSPAWQTILGVGAEDLLDRPFSAFLHPDDRQAATAVLDDVVAHQSSSTFEARCPAKNGATRWVLWNANWIAGERLVYLVGRDVTEIKRSEQRLQGLLNSAPDAFVIVDRAGRIVMVNAQTERLFGYSRGELEGRPVEILVPEAVRERHPALREGYCRAPAVRPMKTGLRLLGRRKDGREIPIDIALSPVETDEGLLVFSAIRDASQG
jgi:PAS domain S-box-containing protein